MGADMLLAIAASPRMTSWGSDASVDVLCTRVKERAAEAASEGDLETELYPELFEDKIRQGGRSGC